MVNCSRWLGYKRNKGTKELEIVEAEAVIIRRIFNEYLDGNSTANIATGLMRDGIKTAQWKNPRTDKVKEKLKKKEEEWLAMSEGQRLKTPLAKWYPTGVVNILTNEKYCGDSISGKTYKVDVLSKKRLPNNGESVKFHNQNTHAGIVSRDTFQMVQEEIARRGGLRGSTDKGRAKHSSKYPLSRIIECGVDGENYRRFMYYEKDGTRVPVWICRLKKVPKDDPRKCHSASIKESEVYRLYGEIMEEIGLNEEFKDALINNITQSLDQDYPEMIQSLQVQIDDTSCEIIGLMKSEIPKEKKAEKMQKLMSKQERLSEELKTATEKMTSQGLNKQRIENIKRTIDELKLGEELNEPLMKANLEKIVILGSKAKFIFKCGLEFEKTID